tara:strand:- start:798 stop:1649 length:852 start_codon:yes stop_codon:yes gene_type:complete
MSVIRKTIDLKKILRLNKIKRNKIGLVPTMGTLHEGHLSLVNEAIENCDEVWVSIFVNPIQFNDPKDFKLYPSDPNGDIKKIHSISKDINLFIPESVREIYPVDPISEKFDFGILDKVMEGAHRPGHFNGVATVLKKLFEIFEPNHVFFGEKDYQQTLIVSKLIDNLFPKISLMVCPTIRNENGLALSSRNNQLSKKYQKICGVIFESLLLAKENCGKMSYLDLNKSIKTKIEKSNSLKLEYFEVRNEKNLEPFTQINKNIRYRAFICVRAKGIRLIDNLLLT